MYITPLKRIKRYADNLERCVVDSVRSISDEARKYALIGATVLGALASNQAQALDLKDAEALDLSSIVRVSVPGDGITMAGDLYRPIEPKTNTGVIILPGWNGTLKDVSYYTPAFSDDHYVLALSMRGFPGAGGTDQCGLKQPDDVAKAIDWLVNNTPVEKGNVFLFGYSQGGQVALLTAARDGVNISGVVALSPATDILRWGSTTNDSDIPNYVRYICNFGVNRSPVDYAMNINVPVMLVHGKEDKRVPPEQSTIMAEALAKYGSEVELYLVKGVTHAINQRWFMYGPAGDKIVEFVNRAFTRGQLASKKPQ